MPRARTTSAADEALMAELCRRGASVTPRQLERWRGAGLLPVPVRTWLGRRGSASTYPEGAADIVEALAEIVKRGTPLHEAALDLFARGLSVSEVVLRSAFLEVLRNGRSQLMAIARRDSGREIGSSDGLDEAFEVADAASASLVDRGGPLNRDVRRRLRHYRSGKGVEAPVADLERSVWTLLLAFAGGGSPAVPDEARAEVLAAMGLEDAPGGESAADRFLAFLAEATLDDLEAVAEKATLVELTWACRGLHALVTLGRFTAFTPLPDDLAAYGRQFAAIVAAPVDKTTGFATAVLMMALAREAHGSAFTEGVDAMVEQVEAIEAEFGAEAVEQFLSGAASEEAKTHNMGRPTRGE